jgi:hypothetical protein
MRIQDFSTFTRNAIAFDRIFDLPDDSSRILKVRVTILPTISPERAKRAIAYPSPLLGGSPTCEGWTRKWSGDTSGVHA